MVKNKFFWFAVILFLNLSLFTFLGHEKYLIFVDEGFSYADANGMDKMMPDIAKDQVCQFNPPIFHKQFSVQPNKRFKYRKIQRHIMDHPPLYFFLLHTVCSFFPNVFSKWLGLGLNFVIFILAQGALYALSREFLSPKKAFLPVIFYGFSVTAICTTLYVRNYMLFTLLCLLACLFAVRVLKSIPPNDNRPYRNNVLYFCLVLFTGTLTHFYFLITAFALCAGICLALLFRKMYKKLCFFSLAALGSVGLCPLLFFCVREQLFHGDRSFGVSQTLQENFLNHHFTLSAWDYVIQRDILGIPALYSVSAWGFILALGFLLYRYQKRLKINAPLVVLSATLIFSVLVLSAVIPFDFANLPDATRRYFFHLGPLLSLLLVVFLDALFPKFKYAFTLQLVIIVGALVSAGANADFSMYLFLKHHIQGQYAHRLHDRTLWIRWQDDEAKWKKLDQALFSFYAKDFVIFQSFDNACYQQMLAQEESRGKSALMLENKGRKDEDCETVSGYNLIFSTWSTCAYLPKEK